MRIAKGGILIGLLLLLMAAVASGCGSSDSNAADDSPTARTVPVISEAAKNLDPCTLLSKGDVESVIGQTVQEPERKGTSCSYDSSESSSFASILLIGQPGTMDDFNYQRNVLGADKAETVPDLGAAAVYVNDQEILVQDKDVLITINGYGSVDKDGIRQLAEKAVANIPS